MAAQAGALVVPDKIPAPWYGHHQQQQRSFQQMDDREGFMLWLRGEFAAANAMIDGLCHHLRAIGEPGEYDAVIGCIQQRRCNWNPVLHMQQYFSVAEVMYALQQVGLRRQQRTRGNEGGARKEFRRGGRGQRGGVEVQGFVGEVNRRDFHGDRMKSNLNMNQTMDGRGTKDNLEEKTKAEEKKESNEISETGNVTKNQGSAQGVVSHVSDEVEVKVEGSCSADGSGSESEDKQNLEFAPKTFVATEICDGKLVNVVEGMKLYEKLLDDSEISKIKALTNDLRASGRRGQLQGQTYVASKKPMKGHGREIIQLGIPSADAPHEDETAVGASKDLKAEPIPALLEDVIDRLLEEQIVTTRPDSCIIDIFNEGDYSQPHYWPHWFGRPVCLLFLTECEICFGKIIPMDPHGNYQGALRLSLSNGSMLVMEGRSANFARRAVPSIRKHRTIVTFIKSLPRKVDSSDARNPSATVPPSHWVPPPVKSPNHNRPVVPQRLNPASAAVAMATSAVHQQLVPPNGLQPIFVPTPVAAAIAFPAAVALAPACAGWPTTPTRHPPRLPVPGTGVFLPAKSSGKLSNTHASSTLTMGNSTMGPSTQAEDSELGKSNSFSSSPKVDDQVEQVKCNGNMDGTGEEPVATNGGLTTEHDVSGSGGEI